MEPVKIGSLTCVPLHPTFGAEVHGVDFSKPISDEQVKDIIAAEDRFGVTVYRNTGLDDFRHVQFSRQLGELEKVPKFRGKDMPDRFAYPELFDAGNTDKDGNIIQKNTRRWWYNKGNGHWHTDSSFNQHRSKYSLLLAHTIPSRGGNTDFADIRAAWRDLPEEQRAPLRGLVAEHDLWHSRKLAAPEVYSEPNELEKSTIPPGYHRLVQTAPDGGETLFLADHIKRIVGWNQEESQKLIDELIAHCSQPQYVISIKWETKGDLVFWDNRMTMHTATPFEDQNEKRDMRRTTVYDDGPESFGVPIAAAA